MKSKDSPTDKLYKGIVERIKKNKITAEEVMSSLDKGYIKVTDITDAKDDKNEELFIKLNMLAMTNNYKCMFSNFEITREYIFNNLKKDKISAKFVLKAIVEGFVTTKEVNALISDKNLETFEEMLTCYTFIRNLGKLANGKKYNRLMIDTKLQIHNSEILPEHHHEEVEVGGVCWYFVGKEKFDKKLDRAQRSIKATVIKHKKGKGN